MSDESEQIIIDKNPEIKADQLYHVIRFSPGQYLISPFGVDPIGELMSGATLLAIMEKDGH